jgi:predicted metal-dependent hydrolase
MISQEDKVKYGTIVIPYQVIKTERVKTSEVIVDADTIVVRTPLGKNKTEIQKLVLDKSGWILKKQREYKEVTAEIIKPSFKENTTLPYLGTNYPIKIVIREQAKNSMDLINGSFVFETKSTETTSGHLRKVYEKWLREKAQFLFKDKVNRYSKKLGVQVMRIAVKNLKKRWGSLTKNGTISLNLNLVKAPEDVIDYIILHELCHLKIKEHSHLYWDLVHKFVPNYQDKIEWLNTNGRSLIEIN